MREDRYDVIHNHAFDAPAITARHRTGRSGGPHGPPTPGRRGRRALRHAAETDAPPTVAGVSEFQASAWRRVVPIDAILPPYVPTSLIDWLPGAGDGAVFAGRLSPEKGAAEAIDIARTAGVRIDVYGDSYDAEYVRARIDPLRAEPGVSVHPAVPRASLWEAMARAAVVLCPAKWDEPFGMVAAEAQACGTPVVAFDRGALGEVVVDGRTGFLVAPDDIDAAADAVKRASGLSRSECRAHAERQPGSRAEPRGSRTALRGSRRRWFRSRGPWLSRGIGSRGGWRWSRGPAAGSAPRPPRPSRPPALTSCLPPVTGEALDAVAARIRDSGGEATPAPTDVSKADDVERLFADVDGMGESLGSRLRGRRAEVGAVRRR